MIKDLNDLVKQVKTRKKIKIAVVAADDKALLGLVDKAIELELAQFILIGDKNKIVKESNKNNYYEIIDQPDQQEASEEAVKLVKNNKAEAIMKGLLHTSTFLKAILNKETGLSRGNLISQISVFEKEYGEGLQLLTDCAINIKPSLYEKKQIIENAVELAIKLGYKRPKVALLSALELINPNIEDTLDAAVLSKMGEREQIKKAIIDGPLALDNAIFPEAAVLKNIEGAVAGAADILVAPDMQVGNVLTKSLTYFAKKEVASAVMGINTPIIMTSRTDSIANKLLSIALACCISQ